MSKLNTDAKDQLRQNGITQADWARRFFDSPTWLGDACGCPDDRCIGYHHGENEQCQCLPALLQEPQP